MEAITHKNTPVQMGFCFKLKMKSWCASFKCVKKTSNSSSGNGSILGKHNLRFKEFKDVCGGLKLWGRNKRSLLPTFLITVQERGLKLH